MRKCMCVCFFVYFVCVFVVVVEVQYRHGRPVLQLMLPSRGEACRFPLRPMMMTVADFLSDIKKEDPGVTATSILTAGNHHNFHTHCS